MCVVENSGRFGGTYAAPITSLMIEKYLNDTIAANRVALAENMEKTNLIPPLMKQKLRTMDSLKQVRETEKGLNDKLRNISDTLQSEDNVSEDEIRADKSKKSKTPADSPFKKPVSKEMVGPAEQKEPVKNKKDSLRKP